MKLPHVVVLSIIGMAVTSLSVLVFTSRRQVSTHDTLTSNESEAVVEPSTSPVPQPRLTLTTEPSATASSLAPQASVFGKPMPSQIGQMLREYKDHALLVLFAPNEPCTFFVDGKPVIGSEVSNLYVSVGVHVIRCERSNGRVNEQRVDVVPDARNPVFF